MTTQTPEGRNLQQKEIAAIVLKTMRFPSDGTAIWRATEKLKLEIPKDENSIIFNDDFASGLAELHKEADSLHTRYLIIQYAAVIALLTLLTGHALPISIPYLGTVDASIAPRGLLDISLVILLLAGAKVSVYTLKKQFYVRLLQTYADSKYGEKIRDFSLFRFGIDNYFSYLNSEDEEYQRRDRPWLRRFANWLISSASVALFCFMITYTILIFASIFTILKAPGFGWLSYLVVGVALAQYLKDLWDNFNAASISYFAEKKPESISPDHS
jgi:hypothetical protein